MFAWTGLMETAKTLRITGVPSESELITGITNKSRYSFARTTCTVCVILFTSSIETGVQKVKIQTLLKSYSCPYITVCTVSCCLIDNV